MNQYQLRFAKFANRFAGHTEVFERMIQLFLCDSPDRLEQIQAGRSEHDWERVAAAAHSLVNITGTMQAFEAAEVARKLEASVRARAYTELDQLVPALEQQIDSALLVVRQYRDPGCRDYS